MDAVESANQPQSEQVGPHATFLGTEPELNFDSPESSPETSGDEEQPEGAEPEQAAGQAEQGEAEQPTVEDWLKDLTQREAEDYQRRYPTAWKNLMSPNTPDDMKQLLIDKINTDQEYAQLRAQQEFSEEEPTLEYEEQQPPPEAIQDPAKIRENYYQRINQQVDTFTDPESRKQLGLTLLKNFGVNVDRLNDPNLPAQDKQELQALVNNASDTGTTLARAAADFVSTFLPHVLPEAIEMVMPGFSRIYERQMYSNQWEAVRSQLDPRGRSLPQFGSEEFKRSSRAAAAQIPGFMDMVFRGSNGQILPPDQQARMKYSILARTMAGERVSPAIVAQAVQTGKRLAATTERRRQAGRALGSGQPTGRGFGGRGGAGSEDDPVMQALDAEISRTNNDIRPVSRYLQQRR